MGPGTTWYNQWFSRTRVGTSAPKKKTETDTQSAFFPQLKIGKVSFTWQHSIQVAINHQDGPLTYPTDGQMGDW